jgi:hypothetical protein
MTPLPLVYAQGVGPVTHYAREAKDCACICATQRARKLGDGLCQCPCHADRKSLCGLVVWRGFSTCRRGRVLCGACHEEACRLQIRTSARVVARKVEVL